MNESILLLAPAIALTAMTTIGGCPSPKTDRDPTRTGATAAEPTVKAAFTNYPKPPLDPGVAPLPRTGHAIVALRDGRAFVAGGHRLGPGGMFNTELVAQCQSFDPRLQAWTDEGVLPKPTFHPALAVLQNADVLVLGGSDDHGAHPTSQRCSLRARRCEVQAAMHAGRAHFPAVTLASGRVLVAGGATYTTGRDDFRALATTEELDPVTGQWSDVAPLRTARDYHTATVLTDGRVLVVGGCSDTASSIALKSAELYDPSTKRWSATGDMGVGRCQHTATLLSDGRVLVTGGSQKYEAVTPTAEIFDSKQGTWIGVGPMARARRAHDAVRLPDGRVWIVGGDPSGRISFEVPSETSEIFDPKQAAFSPARSIASARDGLEAFPFADGRVLVFGGYTGKAIVADPEVLTP